MDKFKGKYRIESNRAKFWDYSSNGAYFLTIVTQNRDCNLGYIENNKMILSDFGKIVETQWMKSFEIRKELFLDEFIIMPNHIHAIVTLDKSDKLEIGLDDIDGSRDVDTHGRAYLQPRTTQSSTPQQPSNNPLKFKRKPQSISSFMAGYKSVINTKIDDFIDANNLNIPKYNKKNHFF